MIVIDYFSEKKKKKKQQQKMLYLFIFSEEKTLFFFFRFLRFRRLLALINNRFQKPSERLAIRTP